MPLYDFLCSECGHQDELIRKIADASTTTCPSCQAQTFTKKVSAAGFALKGTGWYETDFKGGNKAAPTESAGGHACGTGGCGSCP